MNIGPVSMPTRSYQINRMENPRTASEEKRNERFMMDLKQWEPGNSK